jgi:hypothetical protein
MLLKKAKLKMLSEQVKLDKSIELVKKYVPNLEVTLKSDSKLHKAIDKLLKLLGNTKYLSDFWTTLHNWVARPTMVNDSPYQDEWQLILHEGQHAIDSTRLGRLFFSAIYLFPQLLGIAATLLALVLVPFIITGLSPWFLLLFVGGLFLLPLPAIGRAYLEARAYEVSLGVAYWSGTLGDEEFWIDSVCSIFSGNIYYKMWPFKKLTKWWFTKTLNFFKAELPIESAYLNDCKALAKELSR